MAQDPMTPATRRSPAGVSPPAATAPSSPGAATSKALHRAEDSAAASAKRAQHAAEKFQLQLSEMRAEVSAAKGETKVALIEKTSSMDEARSLSAELTKTKKLLIEERKELL